MNRDAASTGCSEGEHRRGISSHHVVLQRRLRSELHRDAGEEEEGTHGCEIDENLLYDKFISRIALITRMSTLAASVQMYKYFWEYSLMDG